MKGEIILIIGGARSGKSRFAVKLAKEMGNEVAFIATCKPQDKEMADRVVRHKKSRPRNWQTVEESADLRKALHRLKKKTDVAIVDCLGLFVSNLLSSALSLRQIEKNVRIFMNTLLNSEFTTIIVSNDVGSGIVPINGLARKFRDVLGLLNQDIAKKAGSVYVMQAGIPVKIK